MATRSKLAVILHADIVDSTRLVQLDESIAHARFQDAFRRLADAVARFGGITHERRGDALVAEFDRASDAVCAALWFQSANHDHNEAVSDPIRPEARVGIALGEVVIADRTVTGAGVVLAQRIEQLAPPGGVCLQGAAYETVPRRLPLEYRSLGDLALKGFSEPVRVYSVTLREGAEIPLPQGQPAQASHQPSLPDKPSIAVLPFRCPPGDREQELFAEGMTEDLTTDLSKVSGIFVVSGTSSRAYAGRQADVKETAAALGVRYVLQGSVRRAADRVRINAQLVDADSGRQIWADRRDGRLDDVFELQDAMGAEVVSALSIELSQGERKRLERVHTHNLDAYELFIRAKATPYPPVPARIENAREMFEQVIALDPDFAGGYAGVAAMLGFAALFDHTDPLPRARRALELARKAIEVDETFGWSYTALAVALLHHHEHEAAIDADRKGIERQPNDADAYAWLALHLALSGQPVQAVEAIDHAIRLNPLFVNGPYLNIRSVLQVIGGDYEGALLTHERNFAQGGPIGPPMLAFAAAAMTALGRMDDAQRKSAELRERFPDFRLTGWNLLAALRDPGERARMHDLMVAAGVPP